MIAHLLLSAVLGGGCAAATMAPVAPSLGPQFVPVQHQPTAVTPRQQSEQQETAQERMRRRFPQPVRVGDLIELPVLDDNHMTIGVIRQAVRTPEGRILLIVAHTGVLRWGGRLVSVPIEAVGIFGRQLASLDMKPEQYASAPTWTGAGGQVIPHDETILIGLAQH
jgi:hypothetical protein